MIDRTHRVVIVPPTEIDVATAPQLRREVDAHDPRLTIVLEMRDVAFCSSSGLAVLIDGRGRCEAAGGAFILQNPSRPVLRLIEIVGMADAFTISRT